ncbi:cytoplasmic protein [Kwoniella mangroviensis CBS 10435]|uniref:Cytoplasmic protein n=1 Tax=Kwoniella mangroviensis CBS 10435 TaxID=1331196 RepID=A0A1B9IRI3_9TREE|nr:cytoplasmic protein [Kwoniella mangroviensis CBS 10435]
MVPPPTRSPVTGNPVPPYYIHSDTLNFRDVHGRSLILRGVNLSGSAKNPNGQPSHIRQNFWESAEAGEGDFMNNPLNLEDGSADIHLARLRAWGYNMLRYVFTWESLEHRGPKQYDYEYMDYIIKVLRKCKEWGFRVFMDPHQDVWSRFTGGSGAPLWTLYACGIDPYGLTPTASAYIHCEWPNAENPKPEEFPAMIWGTNYTRLAGQTIWTLFFAGKTFAPKCVIDGKNIQDYLQDHFIDAVGTLAKKISEEASDILDECVIGWDSVNEPGEGLIGHHDLSKIPDEQQLKKGPTPTPIEGMRLGEGRPQQVQIWNFGAMGPYRGGHELIDPKGRKLWLSKEDEEKRGGGKWGWTRGDSWEMGKCIWAQHGVWDPTTGDLLKPDYFVTSPEDSSHEVEFVADFWSLHWLSYSSRIRIHHPESIHFIQAPVLKQPPKLPKSFLKDRACSSPHFYDGLTLMTKHWNWFNADAIGVIRKKYWSIVQAVRVGEQNIRNMVQGELGVLKQDTVDILGSYPTLIGEIGIPYDMDGKKAYGYVDGGREEGDYSSQQRALDCSMNACDGPNCLNYTIWNYVPDHCHEWSDNWNGEDLSLWSKDDIPRETFHDESKSSPVINSSLSIPTSSSTTLTASRSTTPKIPFTLESISAGDIPPSLILDGSRALSAFCRPFPIRTVGVPDRIDFDIATTAFKYVVKVKLNDIASDQIATEIYVPYVHYASSLGLETSDVGLDGDNSRLSSRNSSRIDLINGDDKDKKNGTSTVRSVNPSIRTKDDINLELDIDVKVTHGRYEINGQTLTWYYDVPSTSVEEKYEIQIKRNGGALRKDVGFVQQGSWFDVCPSGCVIA